MKIEGNKAILSFDNVGGGLVASGNREGKLNCFAIAGKDGKFVWADAVIDGDKVVVSSPSVKEPAAVRYGWVSYAGNLNFYNKDGFRPARSGPTNRTTSQSKQKNQSGDGGESSPLFILLKRKKTTGCAGM